MMEEMYGDWWLPDYEDLKCTGEARLSDTSFSSLHVRGNLSTPPAEEGQLARYLPLGDGSQIIGANDQIIWGVCAAKDVREFGQSTNLVSLFNAQLKYNMPENQTWLFCGLAEGEAHVTQETMVDSIEVRFDVLVDWHKIQHPNVSVAQSGREFHIQIPDDQVTRVRLKEARIEIQETHLFDPFQIEYGHDVAIQITDSLKIEAVLDRWILPLYALIGFLTLAPVRITSIRARLLDSDKMIRLDYHGLDNIEGLNSSMSSSDFPVSIKMLEGSLDSLVSRWLKLYDKHASFVTLLLRSFDRSVVVADFRLLLAALALEQFHTQHFSQRKEGRRTFRRRRNEAIEACLAISEELADWARDKLNHNHKSLKSKIEDVCSMSGRTGEHITTVWPNFARDAADARNRIAHARSRASSDVWEIMTAASGMSWMAYHCYLLRLGLSEETVTSCVTQCHQFERDIQLIKEYRRKKVD